MQEKLRNYILARIGQDDPNLDDVLATFKPRLYRRNELILRQGDVAHHCFFVVKGCIQVFVHDKEGNEMTRDFAIEESWLMEVNSFMQGIAAIENHRTAEATQVLAIDRDNFRRLMEQVPSFEQVYRQVMELSYANSVFRLNTFIAMDGLERLQWLIRHQPRLATRLSNKALASYLGISPETLSRLKSKL